MQSEAQTCPVCLNLDARDVKSWNDGRDATVFDCDVCGEFEISRTAISVYGSGSSLLSRVMRAATSHYLKSSSLRTGRPPMLTTYWFEDRILNNALTLPAPSQQAENIIRFVGERYLMDETSVRQVPKSFPSQIGSPSRDAAMDICGQLVNAGLLTGIDASSMDGREFLALALTLSGWERFERERKGKFSGLDAFIALKFNDERLDRFLADVIKPTVKSLGYTLKDMRDHSEAGLIDNLMRQKIRDSAFVLVDLTHANNGAYWEGGYAEGLGKPVLYLCENSAFDHNEPHFDTNHCTTIKWDTNDADRFVKDLTSTLRRSLNLFS